MGRKLEQLTRGDSKEHIHFPLGSTRIRRRNWKPSRESDIETSSQDSRQPRRTKVDRVESIRNLFRRSRSWDSAKTLEDQPLKENEMINRDRSLDTIGLPLAQNEEADNLYESLKDPKTEDQNKCSHSGTKPILYRSASTSHIPLMESDLNEAPVDDHYDNDQNIDEGKSIINSEKVVKKGQFPYAFLRSKLTSVEEEHSSIRDECGDSGRGTGSHCGSISDIRTSYSETSDSKSSFSESSDAKSSCSDSSDGKSVRGEDIEESNEKGVNSVQSRSNVLSPIPAPTGFGDTDFVVTVRVDGEKPKQNTVYIKLDQNNTEEETESLNKLKNNTKKGQSHLTDEEKLLAKSTDCCHRCLHCSKLTNKSCTEDPPVSYVRRRTMSQPRPYTRVSYPVSSSIKNDGIYEAIFPQDKHIQRTSLDLNILGARLDKLSHLNNINPRLGKLDPRLDKMEISKFESLEKVKISSHETHKRDLRSSSLDRTESWRWLSSIEKQENEGIYYSDSSSYRRRAPSLPRSTPTTVLLPQTPLSNKTFKLVRLIKEESDELGLFISGRRTLGYTIAHIQPGGLTDRYVFLVLFFKSYLTGKCSILINNMI